MSNLPENIQIIFNNNHKLKELLPQPILVSDSPFISALTHKLSHGTKESEKDNIYKIVFKKDSSRELMAINSGELKGLLTTSCIEKGKISDVAGLKKIEIDNKDELLMPILLCIGLYSSIQAKLSYISHLCADIRKHQIDGEQAKFEKISNIIVDCFRSIPDLALDRSMRDAYLSRIVKNNDDCHELYIFQRLQFKDFLESEPRNYSTGYNYYYFNNDGVRYYPDQFFERKVLTHPVFAIFERLVAGRVCEIIISGNYSDSNIQRHIDFISRAQSELQDLISYRLHAFDNFTEERTNQIETNSNLTGYERKNLEQELTQHTDFVKTINKKIFDLLEAKLSSFKILSRLKNQDKITMFILDGKLLINNVELSLN